MQRRIECCRFPDPVGPTTNTKPVLEDIIRRKACSSLEKKPSLSISCIKIPGSKIRATIFSQKPLGRSKHAFPPLDLNILF